MIEKWTCPHCERLLPLSWKLKHLMDEHTGVTVEDRATEGKLDGLNE